MDVGRLGRVLAAAGVPTGPRELAEVLWLARHLPGGPAPAAAAMPAEADELPARVRDVPSPAAATPVATPAPPVPDRVPLHASDSERAPDTVPALPVRVRSGSVLGPGLAVLRALRPLKRTAASPWREELDEDATVRWFAGYGRWRAVMRPTRTRALDLVLIVDRGPSAAIWDGLVDELRILCQQLGAFRDIRVRYLVPSGNGGMGLAPSRGVADGAAARHLVLVVSDCVSSFWRTSAAHRMLAEWGRQCPVAILQPLPEHLWSRTNLPPVSGVLRSTGFAQPNSRLAFTGDRAFTSDRAFARDRSSPRGNAAGVPVPMVEMSPDWLAAWARLVAGTAGPGIAGLAAVVGDAAAVHQVAGPPDDLAPFDRVLRFRGEATPEAYRLAGYLAAAPLTPEVMRVVQAAMLPRSHPSHLAEVWFSGLLEPAASSGSHPRYEFVDGVRDVLLGTLRRHEVTQVLHQVSTFIEHQLDVGARTFTAAVPAREGPLRVSALSRPFARIRAQALARLVAPPPTTPLAGAEADASPARTFPRRTSPDNRTEAVGQAPPRAEVRDDGSGMTSAKLVVAGGFGAGKTTFIGALSEIAPVTSERTMTVAGVGIDDTTLVPGKRTLTTAAETGRITFADDLRVYLVGVPGATRFWFLWDEIVRGAIGAIVVVDTRRLADSFASIDYCEAKGLPFLVALNAFDGGQVYETSAVRAALALAPDVPVMHCDARHRESAKGVVVTLVEHALNSLISQSQASPSALS